LVYGEIRDVLKAFLTETIQKTVTYTEYANRKTVNAMVCVQAIARLVAMVQDGHRLIIGATMICSLL
jgi:histone H3/H4